MATTTRHQQEAGPAPLATTESRHKVARRMSIALVSIGAILTLLQAAGMSLYFEATDEALAEAERGHRLGVFAFWAIGVLIVGLVVARVTRRVAISWGAIAVSAALLAAGVLSIA